MAARDRWTENVECPICGASGTVHWSEDDHPWVRGDFNRSGRAPKGFLIVQEGSNSSSQRVYCENCNIPVDA